MIPVYVLILSGASGSEKAVNKMNFYLIVIVCYQNTVKAFESFTLVICNLCVFLHRGTCAEITIHNVSRVSKRLLSHLTCQYLKTKS
jgi:hypothetical protein